MTTDNRLIKLLKKSRNYEEFLTSIQKFPRHYLSPEKLRWTKEDVRRFYESGRVNAV
jgi:hypothetical protein